MATYEQIRDYARVYMREVDNQVEAAEGAAAFSDGLIYRTLNRKYRKLVEEIAEFDVTKLVDSQTFTYPADAEFIDVGTVPSVSMEGARVERIEDVGQPTRPLPLYRMGRAEYQEWLSVSNLPMGFHENGSNHGWFLEKDRLSIIPRPAGPIEIRAYYVPDIVEATAGNAASTSPELLPRHAHELLAAEIAETLRPEIVPQVEMQDLRKQFRFWLTDVPHEDVRYVHEVNL